MKIIKLYIIASVLLFTTIGNTNLFAQQRLPKYESVYKDAMAAGDKKYAYSLFSEFLAQNPTLDRANLYFQIGTLAFDLSQDFNLVTEYDEYLIYAERVDSCLKLCLQFLNESEIKRDNELFQGVKATDKKLVVAEVYDYVDNIIEENKAKYRNVKKAHEAYIGLNKNYTSCQALYKALCNEFINIKDAYLLMNSDITDKMDDMQTLFDSVNYYLSEYVLLLEKNPVKGYNPVRASVEKIEIFRVDGLSEADFLNRETKIWDYKTWAEQYMQNLDGFARVYQEIIDAESTLSKRIIAFNSNRTLSDNYVGYEVDNMIIDTLNMFGYFPALNCLLAYKEEKLNFLTISRRKINSSDYNDNGKLTMTDKLYYYSNLQTAYNKLERLREDLKGYTESDNTTFLSMNFNTREEFTEYVNDEYLENRIELNNAFENLQKYVIKEENNIRRTHYVNYKKQEIPLFLGSGFYRSAHPQSYITKCIAPAENGILLAGSIISREGFATAYVALSSTDSTNIVWLKTIDIGRMMYDDCATAISPISDGGCFVLVTAKNVSDPELIYSTVIRYNAKGNEVTRITLPEKTLGVGRYINYDEVNEQLLMAFYGVDEFWYSAGGKLTMQKIDLQNNILMKSELKFSGEIIDALPTNNKGLMLIGNYHSIVDEKAKQHVLKSEGTLLQSNIFTALFSNEGKLTKVNLYPLKESNYAVKAVKVTNNSINIIGQQGLGRKDPAILFSIGKLIYLSIDSNGKLIYSNQDIDK